MVERRIALLFLWPIAGCLNSFEREPDQACESCRWVSIGASALTTHVVDRDGRMFGWGWGMFGGLGVPSGDSATPLPIEGACWSEVRGGSDYQIHSCAIDCDGGLWCWGSNANGEVGNGEADGDVTSPARIGTETDWVDVAAGAAVTCGVQADGSAWCWGWIANSRIGHDIGYSYATEPSRVPIEVAIRELDTGQVRTCAIDDAAGLWCWGDPNTTDILPPMRVLAGTTWRAIASGWEHTCGIQTDGSLWCFGANAMGQLGVSGSPTEPVRVDASNDWRHVSAGSEHTCAIRNDGTLWCWGAGSLSGNVTAETIVPPTRVGMRSDWDLLVAEREHTCATTKDGNVFCWGRALANGQPGGATVPTLVLFP